MGTSYGGTTNGEWVVFLSAVADSTQRFKRKKEYEELAGELKEGEVLVMVCEISGSRNPLRILIEDLVAYNWLMDQLDEPWGNLMSVEPFCTTLEVDEVS